MTMRSAWCALRAGTVCLALLVPLASAWADPDDGEKLARRWCAACHLVAPDQQQASTDAPPFAAIARVPGFSREKLAFFLLEPHPKMPNMALSRTEASDLADYIAKLGRTRP
jgi:mono/diheme cytochrome c family protein